MASYAATGAERLFYTADLPLKPGERKAQTQVFSMNPDGSDARQLTSSPAPRLMRPVAPQDPGSSSK